jgi:hypothetical protein
MANKPKERILTVTAHENSFVHVYIFAIFSTGTTREDIINEKTYKIRYWKIICILHFNIKFFSP